MSCPERSVMSMFEEIFRTLVKTALEEADLSVAELRARAEDVLIAAARERGLEVVEESRLRTFYCTNSRCNPKQECSEGFDLTFTPDVDDHQVLACPECGYPAIQEGHSNLDDLMINGSIQSDEEAKKKEVANGQDVSATEA